MLEQQTVGQMLLLAVLLLLLVKRGHGCGISTHTEVGFRALEFLALQQEEAAQEIRQLLLRHQDAFQVRSTKLWPVL